MLEKNSIMLAPLPIATGAPSDIPIELCTSANDVYIDLAAKKSETDIWHLQLALQSAFIMSTMFSLIVFIWLFLERLGYHQTLSEHLFETFQKPLLWLSPIPGALYILFITLNAIRRSLKYPPIRFNRQRREVVYVPKRGRTPIYVPWEKISVGIYQTEPMSPPYAWKELKFGFSEKPESTMVWHGTMMVSCSAAVSCWESIRCFMERECEQLPITDPIGEYKRSNKTFQKELDMMDYAVQVLLPDVIKGWTLPIHLARWVEKWSPKSFPRSVHEWSAHLPAEQWASPSDELLEANSLFREEHGLSGERSNPSDAHAGSNDVIS